METHHKSVHVVAALFRRDWLFGRIASLYTLAGVAGPSQGRRGGDATAERDGRAADAGGGDVSDDA